jgi:hypothetical protein
MNVREIPKRLLPTPDTVRELYLKSGNECAFPNCPERILDRDGNLIGEMCHIEAAMPDGERFNSAQTNEERRASANLLLLCTKHHIITNNVKFYPTAKLRKLKADHEAKYTDVVQRIRDSLVDYTTTAETALARTGARLNQVLGWEHSDENLQILVSDLTELASRLEKVPRRTRQFIAVVVKRGHSGSHDFRALHHDVVEACETDDATVIKHVEILDSHNLGCGEHVEVSEIVLNGLDGWDVWSDLKAFSTKTRVPLEDILVKGQFDLLD